MTSTTPGPKHTSIETINQAQARLLAGDAAAAVALLEAFLSQHSHDAAAWTALGVALRFCGRIDDAGTAFTQALTCDASRADAATGLGMIRLTQGRQQEGWALYQARWRHLGWTERLRYPLQTLWVGRVTPRLRLLLWCEQGLGDAIQFSRYAPWLAQQLAEAGGRLVFEAPPPLLRLFQTSWPTLDIIPTGGIAPMCDAHLPLMDLPSRFGLSVGPGGLPATPLAFPYLWMPAGPDGPPLGEAAANARPLRIGLCWQGRASHPDDRLRSIPAEQFDTLAEVPGAHWVALQKDTLASPRRPWMQQGLNGDEDFADTAAVIASLDGVLSVDTAVAHLAGALDVPVGLLLPAVADWRWGRSGDMTPWYPRTRITRQNADEAWPKVLSRAARGLMLQVRGARSAAGADAKPPDSATGVPLSMREAPPSMDKKLPPKIHAMSIGQLWRQVSIT